MIQLFQREYKSQSGSVKNTTNKEKKEKGWEICIKEIVRMEKMVYNASQILSLEEEAVAEQEILILDREGNLRDRIPIEFQFCNPFEKRLFGDRRSLFLITGIGERGKEKVSISKELSKKQALMYVLRMDKRLIGSGIQFWTAVAPAKGEYLVEWTRPDGTVYYFDEEEGMLKQKTQ